MKRILCLLFLLGHLVTNAQKKTFDIVPLGVYGGGIEGNLSSYLISQKGANAYIALDAGTIMSGIQAAIAQKTFKVEEQEVLKNYIKAYFVSHGHLDHNSGLIINSPTDAKKPIYGLPFTIDIFKKHYFINDTWINFANVGEAPILNKYNYVIMDTLNTLEVPQTNLKIKAFELAHVKPYQSSAVLVASANSCVLYLSDTGADRIEQSKQLENLWKAVAPLIVEKKLKGILLECSFTNAQPEKLLFGHLTPKLFMEEMNKLASFAGIDAMEGLPLIVTHIKPEGDNPKTIAKELHAANNLKLKFIFPKQGKRIEL
ncbi:MAG: 3',5'-cyclic-nucleotide phosphodiesterase [Flavobacterium sp.]|nr:3',5'-cyclic-nucleotide phosphodiesterase [Candidatus Neoflavobacterium equi]